MSLKSQKSLIENKDWSYLIILDASRFDCFEKIFEEYLDGELQKVESPATSTKGWIKEAFGGKNKEKINLEDIVYVSANPHINSLSAGSLSDFELAKKFYEIIDVWNWGWDGEENTVPPNQVNKGALSAKNRFPEKKKVIHYMQPHYPFLGISESNILLSISPGMKKGFMEKIESFLYWRIVNLLGWRKGSKLLDLVGFPPRKEQDFYLRMGEEEAKKAYEKNLRTAFVSVSALVEEIEGKVIITSDHGEALGEKNVFGHPPNAEIPELKEVPWLEITKS